MGLYVRHAPRGQYPAVMRESTAGRVVIVAARNEGERIRATLDALAEALPGARLLVADDASSDDTPQIAMREAPGW